MKPGYNPEINDARPKLTPSSKINVMIVDDSLTVRTIFTRMISGDRSLQVTATASSAEAALEKITDCDVDVILLDLDMPGMGGLDALPRLLKAKTNAQILVVSSLTERGAEHTLTALSMGAVDTMLKPRPGGFDEAYRLALLEKIRALGDHTNSTIEPKVSDKKELTDQPLLSLLKTAGKRPKILAIGASTGGIHALNAVLYALPQHFNLPILITQHLPQSFVPTFARQIERVSNRPTIIAQNGTPIRKGEIIIANGIGHLEAARGAHRNYIHITNHTVSSGCSPSVDPMFSSVANVYDGHAIGIVLSGMGRDGAEGSAELVKAGGRIIAQDAESSAVWGMPGAVTKAGLASANLPPERIAATLGALAWR